MATLEGGGRKASAMLRKLSCGSANSDVEQCRSRLIDKELRADRKRYRSTYRLLLLGKRRRRRQLAEYSGNRKIRRQTNARSVKSRTGPLADYSQLAEMFK